MTAELSSGTIPRRDFILLPLISLLTVLMMTAMAELAARQIWVEKAHDDCLYFTQDRGERRKANCVTMMKNIEGPWVRYQMNDCGYRGTASCGSKPPGTLRIAIIGTSVAFGLHVAYDDFFANRAAPELSSLWGHPVEFQNLGDFGVDLFHSDMIPEEALALKPDAIFYLTVPFDLNRLDSAVGAPVAQIAHPQEPGKPAFNWAAIREALRESRFLYVAQHFMLQDDSFFLRAFAAYVDPYDISRQPTPPVVALRLQRMDSIIARLADRAHAAGVPVFVIPLPNRVEATLINKNISIPNIDPYVFPNRLREIAQKHGVECIDMVQAIRSTTDAEKMYYSVDGHPNAAAHALMAKAVVDYFRQRSAPLLPVPQESSK